MNRPDNMIKYDEMDLKLGIKSSLPHVKSVLALSILLWECSGNPAELNYSTQNGSEIVLADELAENVKKYVAEICEDEGISSEDLIEKINQNQLFKSQLEALIVAFELVWKLAIVDFTDSTMAASAERTGGVRFPKRLSYSVNIDIIHSVIKENEQNYLRVLLSWIGFDIFVTPGFDKTLTYLLSVLSETAVFKLSDGEQDVVFNQSSIYRKLLETSDAVDVSGDKEAKGSLRILKSLLSDSLNPYLRYSNGSVTISDETKDMIEDYQKRVETLLRLYATKNTESDEDENEFGDILNHNLFGMHIKEKNDALSDERPHICIGWSAMGNLEDVASKEDLTSRYVLTWPDAKPKTQGQNIGQVWRFVNDMKVGDYVIFADGNLLHIGRVESDYYYDDTHYDTQSDDYKNTRKVVWLKKDIQRSEVSDSMHRSLGTGMSIWTMNDYRAAIADLLNGTYVKDDDLDSDESIPPAEQKERFKKWMSEQKKDNGEPYSTNTINSYVSQMERGYTQFNKYADYDSIFEIQTSDELIEYKDYLFNAEGFDEFNDRAGNKACSCGIIKYLEFISEFEQEDVDICFNTSLNISFPRNRIIFGAPGTGKSHRVKGDCTELLKNYDLTNYERVTFHPDYSYANFVGTYKPVPYIKEDGEKSVTYEYVPGPFMRTFVNALKSAMSDNPKPYLLIVEEINRANVAAVFGDIFQLLDRGEDEVSEYPIHASEDIKKYLSRELKCSLDKVEQIRIPDNMFIWATMNSADQGVFPMDTAFKRRWDFTYIGINNKMSEIEGYSFTLPNRKRINWNKLRMAINNRLASLKVNEDKLMGPFFLSEKVLKAGDDAFVTAFENKVLMYLFEDAGKQRHTDIFRDNQKSAGDVLLYSVICENFRKKGTEIFCDEIRDAALYEADAVADAVVDSAADEGKISSTTTVDSADNEEVTGNE